MQWILQKFEDTAKLSEALDRLGVSYSWHKVVPFVGDLEPEPVVAERNNVVLFGSYTLWRYAERMDYRPGVFRLSPFLHQACWHPYLLNGPDALILQLKDIPKRLAGETRDWFLRPVDDAKQEPGNVKSSSEIIALADRVLALDEDEIPMGSLRHDTELMLTRPVRILKEWRLWVVDNRIVTYSLYKEGSRVVYRPEIDPEAYEFARQMVALNPSYAQAYVLDVCLTEDGLKLLETNCLNAAGFYAADLQKLVVAIEALPPHGGGR
ncbi:ATP-grasp domain-containing protein [Roseibium sp.]|uniref:ATP-grasp domain-containing protein n=1 Tax=Roseibium sp. TaxID=1936156 RepID=UPI003BB10403